MRLFLSIGENQLLRIIVMRDHYENLEQTTRLILAGQL